MIFPDSLSPLGDAAASRFEALPGSFTGMLRDHPGPVERALPAGPLWLPPSAALAVAAPAAEKSRPDPIIAKLAPPDAGPAAGRSLVPAETAFRLQQLTAALILPVAPATAAATSPGHAESASLASLADQLQARFLGGEPEEPDALDLLEAPLPESAPASGLPLPVPAAATPAAIRAAAGALSTPPKPFFSKAAAPAINPRQGDIFFADPVSATPPPLELHPSTGGVALETDDLSGLPDLFDPAPDTPPGHLLLPIPAEVPNPPPLPATALEQEPGLPFSLTPASLTPSVETASTGLGGLIGGTGLILGGIFLACRLPLLWLALNSASGWEHQLTEAALILQSGAALLALTLGSAVLLQRRWAAPLIIAAGWLAVFTSTLFLGITGYFLGADNGISLDPRDTAWLIAGLLVPLAYLLYFERAAGHSDAWAGDSAPRVPSLMVLLCGLGVALAAASMLRHQPALPLPASPLLTGPPAQAAWLGLLACGVVTAFCAYLRRAAAWWFLLLASLGLAATVGIAGCAGHPGWQVFLTALGRPANLPSLTFLPLLAGLSPLILLLTLAMSRRSFASPPPP